MPDPFEPPDPPVEPTRVRPPSSPWGQEPPPAYAPSPPPFPPPPAPSLPPPYGGPGWSTMPFEHPPPPPSPPPRRSRLLVGLVVATVVGLVCVVALGVLVWADRRDDDGPDRAADDGDRSAATEPEGEGEANGGAAAPSTTPPPEASPPAPSPTTEPPPESDATGRFSYTEYGDDWDFSYGDVALQARFERGWDYDDCGPVEVSGALTDVGCRYASEWTYRALDGDLALTHLVLTMDSPKQAKRVIDQELITADSWQVDDASRLAGRDGAWRANAQGEFIVLTVETHEPGVRDAKSQEYLQYANADILGALGFRF